MRAQTAMSLGSLGVLIAMSNVNDISARIDVAALIGFMLDQPWHKQCEIIPDYMPPFPRPETRPSVQVKCNGGTDHSLFLRYSKGPKQGYFWDIYGDDMDSIELAVFALSQAPAPLTVGPIVFRMQPKASPNATLLKKNSP